MCSNNKPNYCNHRLHDSASPVLTAMHHFNGRFWDFLLFFRETPGGQTHQLIVKQNGLNDADLDKDHGCVFWSKN